MTKHKEKFILILRPRLFGLLMESSARGAGAGATELLFVAPPKQYKNGSGSSCKCLGAAPPKSPFGAAPASPVRKQGAELEPELKQTGSNNGWPCRWAWAVVGWPIVGHAWWTNGSEMDTGYTTLGWLWERNGSVPPRRTRDGPTLNTYVRAYCIRNQLPQHWNRYYY